jgi:hypothetical protein
MLHIFVCSLPWSTIYFRFISLKPLFSKEKLLNIQCVFWFSLQIFFFWNISHSKKNWARYDRNVHRSSCKVPVILVRFEWKLNFSYRFSKNTHIKNFKKILPVEADLFHANGRTDMTKLIVAFRNLRMRLQIEKYKRHETWFIIKYKQFLEHKMLYIIEEESHSRKHGSTQTDLMKDRAKLSWEWSAK